MARWESRVSVILILVLIGIVPLLGSLLSPYLLAVALLTFMFAALAVSWNLFAGYTGYVFFGQPSFFGTGAYVAAVLLSKTEASWFLGATAGGLGAGLVALAVGYPCLRLRGPYFAIATLGLNEALRLIFILDLMKYIPMLWGGTPWKEVTRGDLGIWLPPTAAGARVQVFYAMGFLTVAAVLCTWLVARSRFGLRLMAIREDEVAAQALGVSTTTHKIIAFALSAFFAGFAGGVYAWHLSYIDPYEVFKIGMGIKVIAMAMFGGLGTVLGPLLGALSLAVIGEFVWVKFLWLHQAVLGVIIVVMVLFMPQGMMGMLRDRLIARGKGS